MVAIVLCEWCRIPSRIGVASPACIDISGGSYYLCGISRIGSGWIESLVVGSIFFQKDTNEMAAR